MIVSASRRTDIPAHFAAEFSRALCEGKIMVSHPFKRSMGREISLKRKDVDAFVFWTRNPLPFFPVLDLLDAASFPYYFLVTVNGYPPSIEPAVPGPEEASRFFRSLCSRLGPDRIVWRYDPVLFTPALDVRFHRDNFCFLADRLHPFCRRVIVSLVDRYPKVARRLARQGEACFWPEERLDMAAETLAAFAERCRQSGMEIQACAEPIDTAAWGVPAGKCIDEELLSRLFGLKLRYRKDPGQRPACRCSQSVDIGTYGSCPAGCLYCYAR